LYILEFERRALKDLKRIGKADIRFLKESITKFVENFSTSFEHELMKTGKIKKLRAQTEELYRLKLRSYRVIYIKEDDKLVILVVSVKSRENSYKK
jgi:mRNA interferase RelE/StbE